LIENMKASRVDFVVATRSAGLGEVTFTASSPVGACTHQQQIMKQLGNTDAVSNLFSLHCRGGDLGKTEDCPSEAEGGRLKS